jgi:hypothetical protein
MRNIDRFLHELKELNLSPEDYLIVSSGSLAIHNIRECNDLDILISKKLFHELAQKYPVIVESELSKISLDDIELLYITSYTDPEKDFNYQRNRADIIDGIPFQDLQTCLFFKEISSREKDKKDVELIKNYLNENL